MKLKTKWACSSCTKEFDGSESHTWIEFFVNKHTEDPEFQGQHQFYESIERIGVCYQCCAEAMYKLGMLKAVDKIREQEAKI